MTNEKLLKTIWEAAKEPLRLLVLSVLPVLITSLAELSYWWAGVAIVLLRLLDSVLHEKVKTKTLLESAEGLDFYIDKTTFKVGAYLGRNRSMKQWTFGWVINDFSR